MFETFTRYWNRALKQAVGYISGKLEGVVQAGNIILSHCVNGTQRADFKDQSL